MGIASEQHANTVPTQSPECLHMALMVISVDQRYLRAPLLDALHQVRVDQPSEMVGPWILGTVGHKLRFIAVQQGNIPTDALFKAMVHHPVSASIPGKKDP